MHFHFIVQSIIKNNVLKLSYTNPVGKVSEKHLLFHNIGQCTMKTNKTFVALYGGMALGFLVLGILYAIFSEGKTTKTDIAIIFSIASTLLASFAVLYEEQRKKRTGKKCTSSDADTVTYYVP